MTRFAVTIATVLALLVGTGSFNVLCLCCPGECTPATGRPSCATSCDARPKKSCSSCCTPQLPASPAPKQPIPSPTPCKTPPENCPCLYWTAVPLSQPEHTTGPALLKRLAAVTTFLLLEAAPAPVWRPAAAFIRAGPVALRDSGARPQAWLCLWTI